MSLLSQASLVVTPNAYSEGKLYSVIPSDGSGDMSVVRATTATRVNSAGLVELVPYNLVQYSEQFDNAVWTKVNTTISANATIAPNGTTTADKLIENTVNNTHYAAQNITASNTPFTYSVYVKADTTTRVRVQMSDLTTGDIRLDYNFTTNTSLFNGSGNRGSWSSVSFNKTDLSEGWVKISISGIKGAGSVVSCSVFLLDNSGNSIYAGNGTSGLFIWGAQLNEGTLLPYQKTETRLNIPRLDYSNGTCPSLLVEPQRTNLALYSSSFDNANWVKTRVTISTDVATAPDGTLTADKIISDATLNSHFVRDDFASTIGTVSVFAKADEFTFLKLSTNAFGFQASYFDLVNGTTVQGANHIATIEDYGNGWYRCAIYVSAAFTQFYIENAGNSASPTHTGDGVKGIFIWGAQVEAGTYATSYIPTTSASVTRNADVISKTGISSLIGQTEGSVFWEGQISSTVGFPQLFDLNADGNKFIQIYNSLVSGVPRIGIYVQNVSVLLNDGNIATIAFNTNFRFALAYKNNDYVAYLNGVQVYSNTSTAVPPTSNFGLTAAGQGAETAGKNIKASALWKTRLTNDELERLTGTGFNTYAEMANYYNYITQ